MTVVIAAIDFASFAGDVAIYHGFAGGVYVLGY